MAVKVGAGEERPLLLNPTGSVPHECPKWVNLVPW